MVLISRHKDPLNYAYERPEKGKEAEAIVTLCHPMKATVY